jgi:hypothetical protein
VDRVLTEFKPDIAVVSAGSASLDVGGPILMPLSQLFTFIRKALQKVIANHMESLNHCPTSSTLLKQELGAVSKKIYANDPRGRPYNDSRQMLNGSLWILGTGAPWRDLPSANGL